MKNILFRFLGVFSIIFILSASIRCTSDGQAGPSKEELNLAEFKSYWDRGKAEITSYELEQARYGEIHNGEAVIVFVTEPFSASKQVKLDEPTMPKSDVVNVLKLNLTKKFVTGIYPYSMMLSAFTPVNVRLNPNTLKVTASSQEWCGHTFTQLNLKDDKTYNAKLFSYFESEGDKVTNIKAELLEDEVWTRLRINPNDLPVGNLKVLPSALYQRLSHVKLVPVEAKASLEKAELEGFPNEELLRYQIDYPSLNRKLTIYLKKAFPYEILAWEEQYVSGFGDNAKPLVTKAIKKKSLLVDYWNRHANKDRVFRENLGLTIAGTN